MPRTQEPAARPAQASPTASLPANRPSLAPQSQTAMADKPTLPAANANASTTARPQDNSPQKASPAVARNIVAVKQALAAHDLTAARRHMRGLYANQALSPEIQQLAADVARQERARDSAMANARSCSVKQEPACAVRNARRAVALDPRNPQTQTLLRQATAAQAEANTAYFRQASALPAPMPAAMTFDGRWSAAGRHVATASQQDRSPSTFTIFGLGVPTVAKGRGDAH
ncbi:hypothetical protein [Caballeronia sp. Sq4a]|uniref:hypothetical protein n=1 Tax=Caballeronia sp. Sq4a TaxID=2878152 RepID=UPI0020C0EBBB|nr:hypothetical protein [Caballeronia sp. Sq4a]